MRIFLNKWIEELEFYFKRNEYTTKLSVSVCYALMASVALNLFWQPGHIYSSGITGVAQIITTLLEKNYGIQAPISVVLYGLNVPLFYLAYKKIGKKFTMFTLITLTLTAIFIQLIPETPLTDDPIICAIFGGAISGFATGLVFKNNISSGGLDIISVAIRKRTGQNVGVISMMFNGVIIFTAGFLFGWPYALYSALSIFVSSKVMDAVYTKQKKMQVMIITKKPDEVVAGIQNRLRRGITIMHGAEGAFYHDGQTVLFTVITRYEMASLEKSMRDTDPHAFVSISDTVKILGNFYEPDL